MDIKKISFAKSLKDAVASMFNWDRSMLEGDTESSRYWREQPDLYWSEKFGKPTNSEMGVTVLRYRSDAWSDVRRNMGRQLYW